MAIQLYKSNKHIVLLRCPSCVSGSQIKVFLSDARTHLSEQKINLTHRLQGELLL